MTESLHTIFLAQVMGLYLVIMAIIMLSRATYYRDLLCRIDTNKSSIFSLALLD